MESQRSGPRGQRANARKSAQSGGSRARGKRTQQRPQGGAGQQRFNTPPVGPLNSIRSEATATPEAPPAPRVSSGPTPREAPRTTGARGATPTPRVSQPGRPKAPPAPEPARKAAPENEPAPLRAAWLIEPGLYERLHNWLADAMPFRWRERARRYGYWRRRAIPAALMLVGIILAVVVGNFGISVARQISSAFASAAAINTSQQDATPGSVIISPLNNTAGSPTPGPIAYSVGVWTSNTMPAGGYVTVYVRVSNNGAPVPKARVYLQVGGGSRLGPVTTNAYGMATFPVRYGAGQGTPVFLTATTTINGHTYAGTYTFVAF